MNKKNDWFKTEEEARNKLVTEMEKLGWIKLADTKEIYAPYYIRFRKEEKLIIIGWCEFITFENIKTVSGHILIAITKYLQTVKF